MTMKIPVYVEFDPKTIMREKEQVGRNLRSISF